MLLTVNANNRLAKQCYHCQGLGHVQADCPTLRLNGASSGRCYNCNLLGHLAVSNWPFTKIVCKLLLKTVFREAAPTRVACEMLVLVGVMAPHTVVAFQVTLGQQLVTNVVDQIISHEIVKLRL